MQKTGILILSIMHFGKKYKAEEKRRGGLQETNVEMTDLQRDNWRMC